MNNMKYGRLILVTVICLLVVGLTTSSFGQGRGRGGGGGRGSGGGAGAGSSVGGPPSGIGVDRGISTSSERSGGRSDTGHSTASEKSKGRSDEGLARARAAGLRRADQDLRNNPAITQTLHTSANDLRNGYQAALLTNPDLTFGNYVAATRLGQNLGSRHPGITRDAILAGLASGRSIGRTLQDLGLNERQASEARKLADREIKKTKQ